MNQLPNDLVDIEECPVDIWDIEKSIREFYRLMDYYEDDNSEEIRDRLIKATTILTLSRILLKNLILPEDNNYIKDELTSYKWMIDNLNRVDKRLDDCHKSLAELENAKLYGVNIQRSSRIASYERVLYEIMNHLVYFPLKKAFLRYIRFNGELEIEENGEKIIKKIKKNEKLYLYFVFCELYHSSEALGGIAREEMKYVPSKGFGVTNTSPSTQTIPPKIPTNAETEPEKTHSDTEEYYEDFEYGGVDYD